MGNMTRTVRDLAGKAVRAGGNGGGLVTGGVRLIQVQRQLAALGYSCGGADGIMGPRTRAAVVAFQRDQGIAADGLIGPETMAKLEAAGAASTHSSGSSAGDTQDSATPASSGTSVASTSTSPASGHAPVRAGYGAESSAVFGSARTIDTSWLWLECGIDLWGAEAIANAAYTDAMSRGGPEARFHEGVWLRNQAWAKHYRFDFEDRSLANIAYARTIEETYYAAAAALGRKAEIAPGLEGDAPQGGMGDWTSPTAPGSPSATHREFAHAVFDAFERARYSDDW